jgi:hypothetical protein
MDIGDDSGHGASKAISFSRKNGRKLAAKIEGQWRDVVPTLPRHCQSATVT